MNYITDEEFESRKKWIEKRLEKLELEFRNSIDRMVVSISEHESGNHCQFGKSWNSMSIYQATTRGV